MPTKYRQKTRQKFNAAV